MIWKPIPPCATCVNASATIDLTKDNGLYSSPSTSIPLPPPVSLTRFANGTSGSLISGFAPGTLPSICTVSNGTNSVPSFNHGPLMFEQFCTYGDVVTNALGLILTHQPGSRNPLKVN